MERKTAFVLIAVCFSALLACYSDPQGPRSQRSFDEIYRLVSGKTATEVETILGKPNTQEKLPMGDWRWVWWSYTSLQGDKYAPEVRDKPVHLEIVFSSPRGAQVPDSQWRVDGPLAVSYVFPQPAAGSL